ncbi:hypothetical protein [Amycolatopsis sp. lyj-108]|uniref:hypothetical protein n=1 Tax=Amycolatopsis sp. lyj-108 TaxID=2789286 RepID=UPI00397DE7FE
MTTMLRMRPGAHFAPVADGVYFQTPHTNFVLRGPQALYRLVDRCVSALEDGVTFEELVQATGGDRMRTSVGVLVEALEGKGLLLRSSAAEPMEPALRARFADVLAHLETYADDPQAEFRRLRSSTVVVVGPVDAAASVVTGLMDIGVGRILVDRPLDDEWPGPAGDEWTAVSSVTAADPRPDGAVLIGVVEDPAETAPDWLSAATRSGHPSVAILLSADLGFVSPMLDSDAAVDATWRAWQRALGWWYGGGGDSVSRPLSAVLAGSLAVQRLLNPEERVGSVLSTRRLEVDTFEILLGPSPEPAAAVYAHDLLDSMAAPADEAVDAAGVLATILDLTTPWTGLFEWQIVDELPQLPVASVVLAGRALGVPALSAGFGPDQAHAGTQGILDMLRLRLAALHEPPVGHAVAAAGVDDTRWLADGLLRSIALRDDFAETGLLWDDVTDLQARRLWRALSDYEEVDFEVRVRSWPGVPWQQVRVVDRADGTTLACQWGDEAGNGLHMALAEAISRKTCRAFGVPQTPISSGTVIFNYLTQSAVRSLLTGLHERSVVTAKVVRCPETPLSGGWVWLA